MRLDCYGTEWAHSTVQSHSYYVPNRENIQFAFRILQIGIICQNSSIFMYSICEVEAEKHECDLCGLILCS